MGKLIIKRTATPGKVPNNSELPAGELGLNIPDKRLYVGTGASVMRMLSEHDVTPGGENFIGSGWRDLTSDIIVRSNASSSPTWAQLGATPFYAYAFGVGKECWSNFHVNHDYKLGGDVLIHCHWMSNGINTQPVAWTFDYAVAKGHNQSTNGNFPFASAPYKTGSITVQTAPPSEAWRHMVSEIPTSIILDAVEPDSLIMVRLARVANGGTDNSDTIFGLTIDCHYQTDRFATLNRSPNFYA